MFAGRRSFADVPPACRRIGICALASSCGESNAQRARELGYKREDPEKLIDDFRWFEVPVFGNHVGFTV